MTYDAENFQMFVKVIKMIDFLFRNNVKHEPICHHQLAKWGYLGLVLVDEANPTSSYLAGWRVWRLKIV